MQYLNYADSLEHLAWPVYDGVFLPRDPSMLTGYHDWQWIIAGTTLCLIYWGATAGAHCPLCTVTLLNAKQSAKEATWQQDPSQCTRRAKPQAMQSSPAPRTLAIRSIVNVPPRAASSHLAEEVPAMSLDNCKEEDEDESFHQFHCHRVQQSSMHKEITTPPHQVMCASPTKSNWIDLMWQTMRWLQNCETSLDDEEISWWLLVSPLTNGSDATTKDLTRQMMAAWK